MIRFNCPNCDRRYELPEALARLPLLCKGCGQSLAVPERSTEPEPPPVVAAPPPVPPPPPVPVVPPPAAAAPAPPPAAPPPPPRRLPEPASAPVAVATENRLPPVGGTSANGPPAAHPPLNGLFEKPDALAGLGAAPPPPARLAPPAPERSAGRKWLGAAVDVLVVVTLIAAGVFCGEFLARKSTGAVLRTATSSAKFPPVDLLMWLAPSMLFLLVYALLISRGKSVGGALARRPGA